MNSKSSQCDVPTLGKPMLRCGAYEEPTSGVSLRAGPLSLLLEESSLRYIRWDGVEIVRRIYCAVRDRNWGTVPDQVQHIQQQIEKDSFHVEFDVANVAGEIDFRWHANISGSRDGVITFELDGVAHRAFWKNRIGFCVLHPVKECAGAACRLVIGDAAAKEQRFPKFIAPENPFRGFSSLEHELPGGAWVRLSLEGELFEMEDQRNWTDASFKTFCTPLEHPFPVKVENGHRIRQKITVKVDDTTAVGGKPRRLVRGESHTTAEPVVSLIAESGDVSPLPGVGLCWTPHDEPWSETEFNLLKALRLAHLRVDLHLYKPEHSSQFSAAVADAQGLGVPLELALVVSDDFTHELLSFTDRFRIAGDSIARVMVFHQQHWTTPQCCLDAARECIAAHDSSIPVGGGTLANFMEINRNRPDAAGLDFVVYSIQPQEHASDNASMVETLAAQTETVESARHFLDGCPVVISPVTLTKRVNPYATGATAETAVGELPSSVDRRQMSLFGAVWTLGTIKHLAESEIDAVSFYETIGWKGVMEHSTGSPQPKLFPSIPNSVFPLYFVLADIGEMKGAIVRSVRSSDSLCVAATILDNGERERLAVGNLTGQPQRVRFETDKRQAIVRTLDENNVLAAIQSPTSFRRSTMARPISGAVELTMLPFAYACLDLR